MKNIFSIFPVYLILLACGTSPSEKNENYGFNIGIIADCQYCNCDASGQRHYRKSPVRLAEAVHFLNKQDLEYTIHLGDFIDRDFSSFDNLVPIWNELKSTGYHVLGNHDFSVADSLKPMVFERMNLDQDNRYYSFKKDQWRFIVLDGNDLSFHGSLDLIKKQQRDSLYQSLVKDSLPHLQKWNGGLSQQQLDWVASELEAAEENGEKVGFYCHFPLFPLGAHNMWNGNELTQLISRYACVQFFFNGHNHEGAYQLTNGVHYLTFKAMVNTENESSYAIASFSKDSILVQGYGREPSRSLLIK